MTEQIIRPIVGEREERTWALSDVEVRDKDGGGFHFRGYAAVFDKDSEPLPFIESIKPGAFARSLREMKRPVKLFHNHNQDILLGNTRAGTLTLVEDGRGLLSEADLPDNEWGRPVADGIRRKDIDSMSFGFTTLRDAWNDEGTRRELVEVRLHEVSIVSGFPAYTQTSASVRALANRLEANADALAAAIEALRSGVPLTAEHSVLIEAALASLRIAPEPATFPTAIARARLRLKASAH